MEPEVLLTRVRSQTLAGVPGHCLNSARTNHFIVDDPAYAGGPGEEITADEAFLSGVSACAVLLVTRIARQDGMELQRAKANIEGVRTKADPANFRSIQLEFLLSGVTHEQA